MVKCPFIQKYFFLFMNICKQTLSRVAVLYQVDSSCRCTSCLKIIGWCCGIFEQSLLMYPICDFCRKHWHVSLMLMLTAVCHLMNLFYVFAVGCNAGWFVLKYLLYLHFAKHSTKSTFSCWLHFVCCFVAHFTVTQEVLFYAKTSATYWCQWEQ